MDNTVSPASFGKKYSVELSLEMNPFIYYSVASFNDVNEAYKWLSDLHNLILSEHILQITDSQGDVVFHLSYLLVFDEDLNKERFVLNKQWTSVPEDFVQSVLPF